MPKKELFIERCMEILDREETGYLSMCRENQPYCIPLNFFYDRNQAKIYIHTGLKGMKWDFLAENSRVCFTVAVPGRKRTGENPCRYTYEFESIIVFGTASRVDAQGEVRDSLNKLINKYRVAPVLPVPEEKLAKLRMIRIDIEKITGRQNL